MEPVASAMSIDTHFHALPPAYIDALSAAGGDPSGYPTPEWSVEAALKSMALVGTSLGIYYFLFVLIKTLKESSRF